MKGDIMYKNNTMDKIEAQDKVDAARDLTSEAVFSSKTKPKEEDTSKLHLCKVPDLLRFLINVATGHERIRIAAFEDDKSYKLYQADVIYKKDTGDFGITILCSRIHRIIDD